MSRIKSLGPVGARRAQWALAAVMMIAALFRLSALDSVPPPLNQDEASRGYDAWSLLETGADRNGQKWPLFTKSFGEGDYPPALTVYLTMPFVAILGPTAVAMRMPNAVFGVVTVFVLFSWLRRHVGALVALVAAAVLAVDPWHVSLTRTAIEGGFAPFLLATAMLGLSRSGLLPPVESSASERGSDEAAANGTRRREAWGFLAAVMLAFHAWVSSATRLFTPLLCLAVVVIYRRHYACLLRDGAGRRILAAAALGLVLGGWPLWWTAFSHPEFLAARARATLIDFTGLPATDVALQLLQNFLAYVDPRAWFIYGRDVVGTRLPGLGQHLAMAAPLIILGMASAVAKARKGPWGRLLLAWFFLGLLPAIICKEDHPHPTRQVGGLLLWSIFAGMGGVWLWTEWNRRPIPRSRRVGTTAIVGLLIGVNVLIFANRYFWTYPAFAESGFQATLVKAMKFAAERSREYDFVLVTGRANEPYIYALLFEPVAPRVLAARPFVEAPGPSHFHQVLRAGKWFFAPTAPDEFPEAKRRFEEQWSTLAPGATGLVVTTPGVFNEGERLATLIGSKVGGDEEAFEIRRWRIPG